MSNRGADSEGLNVPTNGRQEGTDTNNGDGDTKENILGRRGK